MKRFAATALVLAALAVLSSEATAETRPLVLLYTNDIHDHVRPGPGNQGGLAYVAGYVESVRERRGDVLLLDGGDVLEKGDLVAYRTDGRVTFQALQHIGYDAIVPGNHDITGYGQGLVLLRRAAGSVPMICCNLLDNKGKPIFPPSRIVQVQGVDVGIVAATAPPGLTISLRDSKNLLTWVETLDLLEEEARRLRPQVHLLVALLHLPSRSARLVSERIPEFDVLVSGHDHEVLHEPLVVEETGALIVQAGSKSNYVGHLELEIDLETRSVVGHKGHLAAMEHGEIRPDPVLEAWIDGQERLYAPRAKQIVAHSPQEFRDEELSGLFAQALVEECAVDLAVANGMLVQNMIPAAAVDYSTVFATGAALAAERQVFRVEMRGCEVLRWVDQGRFRTTYPRWAGFSANVDYDRPLGQRVLESSIEPDRIYRVAVLGADWSALKGETGWARVFKFQPTIHGSKLLPCSMPSLGAWASFREFFSTALLRRQPIPPREVELLDLPMTDVLEAFLRRRFPPAAVDGQSPGTR